MISKFCVVFVALIMVAGPCLVAADKPISDDAIVDQVRIKLAGDQVVKGGALNVDVKAGVVTLSGTVEQDKQKDRAARLAKKVKGVKQVVNNITLRDKNPGK